MTDNASSVSPRSRVDAWVDIAIVSAVFALAAWLYPQIDAAIGLPPLFHGVAAMPTAFITVILLMRWRGVRFSDIRLRRPARWWPLPLWIIAIVAAVLAVYQIGGPYIVAWTGFAPDNSRLMLMIGNLPIFILATTIAWITAAFFEEIVFRGFVLSRIHTGVGGGKVAIAVAWVLSSLLFGALHFLDGVGQVMLASLAGLVIGLFVILPRQTLWPAIIAHGVLNTIGFVQVYLIELPPGAG